MVERDFTEALEAGAIANINADLRRAHVNPSKIVVVKRTELAALRAKAAAAEGLAEALKPFADYADGVDAISGETFIPNTDWLTIVTLHEHAKPVATVADLYRARDALAAYRESGG